ncbi:MAG: hypothetical protein QN194_16270 [Armatimonadota bacterium]|nr:hypothetical protein [Armatimonadota bacterium]
MHGESRPRRALHREVVEAHQPHPAVCQDRGRARIEVDAGVGDPAGAEQSGVARAEEEPLTRLWGQAADDAGVDDPGKLSRTTPPAP